MPDNFNTHIAVRQRPLLLLAEACGGAAISGDSTHTVQGSAGTVEAYIRYGWNYALLLRDGPSERALVPGPLYRCMAAGQIMRFEEITRCPIEIQDTLNPVLPDRILHIPELEGGEKQLLSRQGFNIVATANLRDRGVNEMSAALKRRFKMGLHERLDRMHCRGRRTPLGQAAVACQPRGRTAPLSHVSRTTDLYFAPPKGSLTISNELIQPHR